MHVLVLGAAGMVGRKLVERLLKDGRLGKSDITKMTLHDVVAPATPDKPGFSVEVHAGDFAVPGAAEKLIAGRPEVPVFMGAQEPLLNTKAEAQMRYQMFGSRTLGNEGYLGCFAKDGGSRDEVEPLPPPYSRFATIQAQAEPAADFIIRTIRANPHEVTMYCGGPMTNLALAVMLAPDIVPITSTSANIPRR